MLHGGGHVSCSQTLSICNSVCHESRFTERSHRNRKKKSVSPRMVSLGCLCLIYEAVYGIWNNDDLIALWNRMLPFENKRKCTHLAWFLLSYFIVSFLGLGRGVFRILDRSKFSTTKSVTQHRKLQVVTSHLTWDQAFFFIERLRHTRYPYSDTQCLQTSLLIFKFCQPQNKRILFCFDGQ